MHQTTLSLRIATLNVRSVREQGRYREVEKHMQNSADDILVLTETIHAEELTNSRYQTLKEERVQLPKIVLVQPETENSQAVGPISLGSEQSESTKEK